MQEHSAGDICIASDAHLVSMCIVFDLEEPRPRKQADDCALEYHLTIAFDTGPAAALCFFESPSGRPVAPRIGSSSAASSVSCLSAGERGSCDRMRMDLVISFDNSSPA